MVNEQQPQSMISIEYKGNILLLFTGLVLGYQFTRLAQHVATLPIVKQYTQSWSYTAYLAVLLGMQFLLTRSVLWVQLTSKLWYSDEIYGGILISAAFMGFFKCNTLLASCIHAFVMQAITYEASKWLKLNVMQQQQL